MTRIMHGIWHDSNFPDENNHTGSWKKMNPDAAMWLWTFAEAERVLFANHPELTDYYRSTDQIVGKAGMLRFALIEHYGGIYLDFDVECIKPFGKLWESALLLQFCHEYPALISDTAFGSAEPRHPFWTALLSRFNLPIPSTCLEAALLWGAAPILRIACENDFSYDFRPIMGEYVTHHSKRTWEGKTV